MFAVGPLAGLAGLGSSRWMVCGKSPIPIPEQFSYCNLGGTWGAGLKLAGYDAIVVQGRSESPAYILVDPDKAEIRDARSVWGRGCIETRESLKAELGGSACVVAIGPAGENMATMASLIAEHDASGSGGLGAVMGSKNLKAIVVRPRHEGVKVAHPEILSQLTAYFREVGRGWGRIYGPQAAALSKILGGSRAKSDPCYGCLGRCGRSVYEAEDGTKGKFFCQQAHFYISWAERYYGKWNDVPFYAGKVCNEYGVDTTAVDVLTWWLHRCHQAGILTDEGTGIPISKVGSLEFVETMVRKVSLREGFGELLAQGVLKAAAAVGPEARRQIDQRMSFRYGQGVGGGDDYGPRLFITTALLHAVEPRPAIQQFHEVGMPIFKWLSWLENPESSYFSTDALRAFSTKFWGSELAVDFSTYEGKALAAKRIQDRQYAKECLILCDFMWPILFNRYSEDYAGDTTLESKVLSAVTGKDVDEHGLYGMGERVFNLQRAILVRERGQGRADDILPDHWHTAPLEGDLANLDCLLPGKGGEIISRKGAVVDRQEFERMKDEYYRLRGWDVASGLQTAATLRELGLEEVAQDLRQRQLATA